MTYMKTEARAEAERLWPKGWPNRNMMIASFVAGAVWAAPRPAYPAEHDRQVAERAWDQAHMDGRLDERTHIEIFDADPHHSPNRANPYRAAKGDQK